jgi:hypothetical protein
LSAFSPLITKPLAKIFTDTGILTYKAVQTSVHNDTVTIVATDVAGNKAEQLITVSVKIFARGFVINGGLGQHKERQQSNHPSHRR